MSYYTALASSWGSSLSNPNVTQIKQQIDNLPVPMAINDVGTHSSTLIAGHFLNFITKSKHNTYTELDQTTMRFEKGDDFDPKKVHGVIGRANTIACTILHLKNNIYEVSCANNQIMSALCMNSQIVYGGGLNNFCAVDSIAQEGSEIVLRTNSIVNDFTLDKMWKTKNFVSGQTESNNETMRSLTEKGLGEDANTVTRDVISKVAAALGELNSKALAMLFCGPSDVYLDFTKKDVPSTYRIGSRNIELPGSYSVKICTNQYSYGKFFYTFEGKEFSIVLKTQKTLKSIVSNVLSTFLFYRITSSTRTNDKSKYMSQLGLYDIGFDLSFFMNNVLHYGTSAPGIFKTEYNPFTNIRAFQYTCALRYRYAIKFRSLVVPSEDIILDTIKYRFYIPGVSGAEAKQQDEMFEHMVSLDKYVITPIEYLDFISNYDASNSYTGNVPKLNKAAVDIMKDRRKRNLGDLVIESSSKASMFASKEQMNMDAFTQNIIGKLFEGDLDIKVFYEQQSGSCFLSNTKNLDKTSPYWIAGGQNGQVFSGYYETNEKEKIPIAIKRVPLSDDTVSLSCPVANHNTIMCKELVNEGYISLIVSQMVEQGISPHFVKIYSIFVCDDNLSETSKKVGNIELISNARIKSNELLDMIKNIIDDPTDTLSESFGKLNPDQKFSLFANIILIASEKDKRIMSDVLDMFVTKNRALAMELKNEMKTHSTDSDGLVAYTKLAKSLMVFTLSKIDGEDIMARIQASAHNSSRIKKMVDSIKQGIDLLHDTSFVDWIEGMKNLVLDSVPIPSASQTPEAGFSISNYIPSNPFSSARASIFGEYKSSSVFFVMEKIDGDMSDLNKMVAEIQYQLHKQGEKNIPSFEFYLNNIMAQVCIALIHFQTYFLGMHNDFHIGNVFLKYCDATIFRGGPLSELASFNYSNDEINCVVPNIGLLAKIGDMGFSRITIDRDHDKALKPLEITPYKHPKNTLLFMKHAERSTGLDLFKHIFGDNEWNREEKEAIVKLNTNKNHQSTLLSGSANLETVKAENIYDPAMDFNILMFNLCINEYTYNSPIVNEYREMMLGKDANINDVFINNQSMLTTLIMMKKGIKHGGLTSYLASQKTFIITPYEFLKNSKILRSFVTHT